jgi:hypothetical protein
MTKDELTCPPFSEVHDQPDNNLIVVWWNDEAGGDRFKVIFYDQLPDLVKQNILEQIKNFFP